MIFFTKPLEVGFDFGDSRKKIFEAKLKNIKKERKNLLMEATEEICYKGRKRIEIKGKPKNNFFQ